MHLSSSEDTIKIVKRKKKKNTKRERVIVKNITSKGWLGVQNIYEINSDD